jgi:hypothetical protein
MIPLQVYAGGALLLTVVGFGAGWTVRDWKADSDQLGAVKAGIERGKEQQELADYRAGRYEDQRHEAQQQSILRDTEIRTIYRDVEVPSECEPPAAALLVLDNAAASASAQAAGQHVATLSADPGEAVAVP